MNHLQFVLFFCFWPLSMAYVLPRILDDWREEVHVLFGVVAVVVWIVFSIILW